MAVSRVRLDWSIFTQSYHLVVIHDHNTVLISEQHNTENHEERNRISQEHPNDRDTLVGSRIKGHLAVTRGGFST
jgi:hypothetical protein